MTAHSLRPWVRGRRWDSWRTLGAVICIASALGVVIVAALALAPFVAVGR